MVIFFSRNNQPINHIGFQIVNILNQSAKIETEFNPPNPGLQMIVTYTWGKND